MAILMGFAKDFVEMLAKEKMGRVPFAALGLSILLGIGCDFTMEI